MKTINNYILERLNPRHLGSTTYTKVPGKLSIEAIDPEEFRLYITGSDWYTCIATPPKCDCFFERPYLILWSAEAGGFLAVSQIKGKIFILWVEADGFTIPEDPEEAFENFSNNTIFKEVFAFCDLYEEDDFNFIKNMSDPIKKLIDGFKKTRI